MATPPEPPESTASSSSSHRRGGAHRLPADAEAPHTALAALGAHSRVLHFNVTEHPTAAWTAQQIVDAFPDDSAPSYLLRDRDSVYGHVFRQRVKGMGVGEVLTAPRGVTDAQGPPTLAGFIECPAVPLAEHVRHMSYEDWLRDKVVYGIPEAVVDRLQQLREELDLTQILYEVNYGRQIPYALQLENLRLINERVIPQLK
jgi:hypothetical protein